MALFVARSRIAAPPEHVFRWHERPAALERLMPPWERTEVVERTGSGVREGARIVLRVPIGPVRARWMAALTAHDEGRGFRDEQIEGPFSRWAHTHRFEVGEGGGCELVDRIEYALPLGPLGEWFAGRAVRSRLRRTFAYRHMISAADIARHMAVADRGPLRIAVSGARGLIGSALVPFLSAGGHRVVPLVRPSGRGGPESIPWDPSAGRLRGADLEGLDAVVHLAGENIAAGRWTPRRKARILRSRAEGTRLLAGALAGLERPPRAFLCASAIGIYGDRGEEEIDERSEPGKGFLAEVCREWEAAVEPAAKRGIRVVHFRFGMVLSAAGGALARMLPAFKAGLGGRIGTGRQFVSWISREDVLGTIHFALFHEGLSGAVDVTSPGPVEQAEFARVLAGVLSRPASVPLPRPVVRAAFGEMGEALLLEGARVLPRRLLESGYRFFLPGLEDALRFELGRLRGLPEGLAFSS